MTRHPLPLYVSEAILRTEDNRPNVITKDAPIALITQEIPRVLEAVSPEQQIKSKYVFLRNCNIADIIISEHLYYELFPTKSLLRPTDLSALKNELPLSLLSFKRLFFFFLIFHFCPAFILPCAPLEGAVKASYKSDSDWTCYPLRAPHFPTCLAFALALFTA